MTQRTCDVCGETVTGKQGKRYCSKPCAAKASRDRNERGCEVDGCERPHGARGMCYSHYGAWHRKVNGRTRNATTFTITCIVCEATHEASRQQSKFCSDKCKGQHYSATMRTKSRLPWDHPVMLLIAEGRRPKPKPRAPIVETRTARECPGCAAWFCPLQRAGATMVYCAKSCAARMSRRRRRAREHGATGTWTWSEFMRIARKFDYCCAYCGEKPARLDAEHVVPLSRGGSDSPSNLLPTCLMCNSSKCAMTLAEWTVWLQTRGLPPRRTSWVMGDPRYSHLSYTETAVVTAA